MLNHRSSKKCTEAHTISRESRRRFLKELGLTSSGMMLTPHLGGLQAFAQQPVGLSGGNPIMPGSGMCDPHGRVFEGAVYVYASHDMSAAERAKAPPATQPPGGFAAAFSTPGQGGGAPGGGAPPFGPPGGVPGGGAGGAPPFGPPGGAPGRGPGGGGGRPGGFGGGFPFRMDDWWVWKTDDFISWKQVSTIKPEQTYWGKPLSWCWATDAISHNGKYYVYVSIGPQDIGVVVSDTPTGPWKDPLGKPLVARGFVNTAARDPGVLQDTDGSTYLVFGTFDYYLAKLGDDMISFAEAPRKIEVEHPMGPVADGKTDDKPYLHKRNGKYYLSWGCFYAMSDNLYGPYEYKGSVINKEHTAPDFQKGLLQDRHASFFQFHGQWYFLCNDQSWPGQSDTFRTAVVSYLHYRENGEMAPVDLNTLGVGQYDANAPRIEAENFFRIDRGEVREGNGGFEVRGLKSGSSLVYPNVSNLKPNSSLVLSGASAAKGVQVEVRSKDAKGKLLGTVQFPSTGDWTKYHDAQTQLRNGGGRENLCFVLKGAPGELLRLDSFHLTG